MRTSQNARQISHCTELDTLKSDECSFASNPLSHPGHPTCPFTTFPARGPPTRQPTRYRTQRIRFLQSAGSTGRRNRPSERLPKVSLTQEGMPKACSSPGSTSMDALHPSRSTAHDEGGSAQCRTVCSASHIHYLGRDGTSSTQPRGSWPSIASVRAGV